MTSIFDKLKLRPFERRLVVVIGIVVFLVAQYFLVWPRFGDVGKMDAQREAAKKELAKFREEIAQTNKFAAELAKLEGAGAAVPPEDQSSDLMRTIQIQSQQAQVQIQTVSKPFTRTNEFFLEQSVTVVTLATEDQLLDFLYSLGSGNSLIRVRDLTMRPDQTRTKLNATIKLVASYQKNKPVLRSAAAPATPAAAPPAAKPSVPAAPKPAAPQPPTPTRKKL
jgi:hypothetical protein